MYSWHRSAWDKASHLLFFTFSAAVFSCRCIFHQGRLRKIPQSKIQIKKWVLFHLCNSIILLSGQTGFMGDKRVFDGKGVRQIRIVCVCVCVFWTMRWMHTGVSKAQDKCSLLRDSSDWSRECWRSCFAIRRALLPGELHHFSGIKQCDLYAENTSVTLTKSTGYQLQTISLCVGGVFGTRRGVIKKSRFTFQPHCFTWRLNVVWHFKKLTWCAATTSTNSLAAVN